MYEAFYQLSVDPFRLSPDHRFCYEHPSFKKARAYMQYALGRAEGFAMVTGAPGNGKTTLINELLANLSEMQHTVARLATTQLHGEDFLRAVGYAFNLSVDGLDQATVLRDIEQFLIRQAQCGRKVLLVIDEAQDLHDSALTELRLLANMQHGTELLLQAFLVGQDSLASMLHTPKMQQFRQRVIAACHLESLTEQQTREYVMHRLKCAGWDANPTLDDNVFPKIFQFSAGVPRQINLIASRLLLHGWAEGKNALDRHDAEVVVEELKQEQLAPAELYNRVSNLPSPDSATVQKNVREHHGTHAENEAQPATLEARARVPVLNGLVATTNAMRAVGDQATRSPVSVLREVICNEPAHTEADFSTNVAAVRADLRTAPVTPVRNEVSRGDAQRNVAPLDPHLVQASASPVSVRAGTLASDSPEQAPGDSERSAESNEKALREPQYQILTEQRFVQQVARYNDRKGSRRFIYWMVGLSLGAIGISVAQIYAPELVDLRSTWKQIIEFIKPSSANVKAQAEQLDATAEPSISIGKPIAQPKHDAGETNDSRMTGFATNSSRQPATPLTESIAGSIRRVDNPIAAPTGVVSKDDGLDTSAVERDTSGQPLNTLWLTMLRESTHATVPPSVVTLETPQLAASTAVTTIDVSHFAQADVKHPADSLERELAKELEGHVEQIERTDEQTLRISLGRHLSFSAGQSTISPSPHPSLSQLARVLDRHPHLWVQIVAHTSSKPSPQTDPRVAERLNISLSEARANAVAAYLTQLGVPPAQIATEGRGGTEPLTTNANAAGRSINRRIEVYLRATQS